MEDVFLFCTWFPQPHLLCNSNLKEKLILDKATHNLTAYQLNSDRVNKMRACRSPRWGTLSWMLPLCKLSAHPASKWQSYATSCRRHSSNVNCCGALKQGRWVGTSLYFTLARAMAVTLNSLKGYFSKDYDVYLEM